MEPEPSFTERDALVALLARARFGCALLVIVPRISARPIGSQQTARS